MYIYNLLSTLLTLTNKTTFLHKISSLNNLTRNSQWYPRQRSPVPLYLSTVYSTRVFNIYMNLKIKGYFIEDRFLEVLLQVKNSIHT